MYSYIYLCIIHTHTHSHTHTLTLASYTCKFSEYHTHRKGSRPVFIQLKTTRESHLYTGPPCCTLAHNLRPHTLVAQLDNVGILDGMRNVKLRGMTGQPMQVFQGWNDGLLHVSPSSRSSLSLSSLSLAHLSLCLRLTSLSPILTSSLCACRLCCELPPPSLPLAVRVRLSAVIGSDFSSLFGWLPTTRLLVPRFYTHYCPTYRCHL